MKHILIHKPRIEYTPEDRVRLVFDLKLSDKEEVYPLYYEVEKSYEQYLVTEVADAAIICLLLYAMEHGYSLVSEAPVSERLHHQLTSYLIPAISQHVAKRYSFIEIQAERLHIEFHPTAVGTGLSCGVDSFYSVYKGLSHAEGSPLRLTHACLFNAGAFGMYGGEDGRRKYRECCEKFYPVTQRLGLELFTCDSNMNEFLHQDHMATHVFRTLSIPMAVQKLFSLYYFASGFPYNEFAFSAKGPAQYEILILPLISNQNLRYEEVGGETTRQGKVAFIAPFDEPQRSLTVCVGESKNCTSCRKCLRTMLNLHLAGQLDAYRQVFDVDWFYKHRKKVMRWALMEYWRSDMPEIVSALKQRHMVNLFDRFLASVMFPFHMAKGFIRKYKFKKANNAKW